MKILYIDDNQLNLRLVQKMLRHQHQVITCLSVTKDIKLAYQEKPELQRMRCTEIENVS